MLIETEIQGNNSLQQTTNGSIRPFFEIVNMELDLDRNVGQVLGQLCGLLIDVYQYWGAKVSQMRRRTVSLPDFGLRETIHAANQYDV